MVNDGLVSASGDTRGIVDPAAMMRHVDFARYEPGPELVGLVEWFWSVQWDLPDGQFHDQEVLNHPAGNISIGTIDDSDLPLDPPEGRLYGVFTEVSKRHLVGAGWTVAARISVGALGAFLDGPAKAASNARLDIVKGLPGLDRPDIVRDVSALGSQVERVDVLRQALSEVVGRRCASMLAEAREVVDLASLAERDRSIRRVEQLAEAGSVSVRTLQRLFDQHVGVTPAFVIRRWGILEAVESALADTDGEEGWKGWSALAAELGYSDQAHLTRDFRHHLGISPSTYRAKVRT